MRDRDTIDAELRLLAAVRRSIREQGGEPSSRQVDELLDERNGEPTTAADDLDRMNAIARNRSSLIRV